MGNKETYIYRLVCPGGHDVTFVDGAYYCAACGCSYHYEKLLHIPVEKEPSTYHPTVYGHPN